MILLESEREYLKRLIGELEAKTTGEIRLMIVRRSGRFPLVAPLVFLSLTTVSLMILWFERVRMLACPEWVLPAIFGGAALIAMVAARLPLLTRLFYSKIDRRIAAQTRAEVEFHRQGLTATESRTGVFIFVSLLEHQAVVLADKGIAERCPPKTWNGVVHKITSGAKQGRWAPKLEEALRLCGEVLEDHFPSNGEARDQLPNDVIVE